METNREKYRAQGYWDTIRYIDIHLTEAPKKDKNRSLVNQLKEKKKKMELASSGTPLLTDNGTQSYVACLSAQ